MKANYISYQETNQFSKLVIDYINQDPKLRPFVSHFSNLEDFGKQIKERSNNQINREVLVSVLERQNSNILLSDISRSNMELLRSDQTFTITTGHQVCLFTGPLYFFYKIISTINLTEQLKINYPRKNFVPVFWMATEDHDLKEINHVNLFGKNIKWESKYTGSVGRMNLQGIKKTLDQLESMLGSSNNAKELILLFKKSYYEHNNLSDATRFLVNKLFGKYGLLIIDGDDKDLKKEFILHIKKDVLDQGFVKNITDSTSKLSVDYKAQAFVRQINFFRLLDKDRVLITKEHEVTEGEIEDFPEQFSPNVLLRPLYQETVLPNIGVVGGGAEVAYWLQLKTLFQKEETPFPILVLRNSVMLISVKQYSKIRSFGFQFKDIFKDEHDLQKQYIRDIRSSDISLISEKKEIERVYFNILKKNSDEGMKISIKAQLKKQLSLLEKLELKLLRLEKDNHKTVLNQISKIKKQLFPNNILQERSDSFIQFYLEYGDNFIETLKDNLDPLNSNFVVLSY